MQDVLGSAARLGEADHEWLHQLVADWQMLADLAFADLALWVETGAGWRAAAQVRPTTGFSVFADDLVGVSADADLASRLDATVSAGAGSIVEEAADGEDVQVESIPVGRAGHAIAVLTCHRRVGNIGRRGRLETRYLTLAARLFTMIAEGSFPDAGGASSGRGGAPRVGDGVVELDAHGDVTYASPNAVSALRRLGVESNAVGLRLSNALDSRGVSAPGGPEEATVVLAGRAPWHAELRQGSAVVMVRAVPLLAQGRRVGAALLLRDITELRRRDQELLTKDATIREVHHRVKNNLQTVAALLRLQARRLPDEQARRALADAGRRVGVIAAVHESLSEGFGGAVDFDDVAARGLSSSIEVARRSDAAITSRLEGSFGVLASEDATSLAMVLGELVQNAVEHGLGDGGGCVTVRAERAGERLEVHVIDDGVGYERADTAPTARTRGGLGTQIVTTFVEDLHGGIAWTPLATGGTDAWFTARLRPVNGPS